MRIRVVASGIAVAAVVLVGMAWYVRSTPPETPAPVAVRFMPTWLAGPSAADPASSDTTIDSSALVGTQENVLPNDETGDGVIAGRVYDAATRVGIAEALVQASPKAGGLVRTSDPTDASGTYRIEELPCGAFDVRLEEAPGYPPPDRSDAEVIGVAGGETITGVDFAVERGITLRGRVVDGQNGPATGAKVRSLKRHRPPEVTESGPEGEFAFQVKPSRPVFLVATKGETVSDVAGPLRLQSEDHRDIVLRLKGGGSIAGRVIDRTGRGVPDVYAVAEPCGHDGWEYHQQRYSRTDASGSFTITRLCPATYGMFVYVPEAGGDLATFGIFGEPNAKTTDAFVGSLKETIEEDTGQPLSDEAFEELSDKVEEVWKNPPAPLAEALAGVHGSPFGEGENELSRVEVATGQHVTGVRLFIGEVTDERWATLSGNGRDLAGRVVTAQGEPIPNATISANGTQHGTTTSRADGTFRFIGLKEGPYWLSAHHESYSRRHLRAVFAGREDIEIVMAAYGGVVGRVVEAATEKPVTRYELGLKEGRHTGKDPWTTTSERGASPFPGLTHDYRPPFRFIRFSNEEGRFSLAHVPPGAVTLFAKAQGYQMGILTLPDVPVGAWLENVTIELQQGAGLDGRVVTADGKPVMGATINTKCSASSGLAKTGSDGSFALDTALPGMRGLWALHPDYAPGYARIGGGDPTIVLSGGGTLRGTVTLEGKPMHGANVTVSLEDVLDRALEDPGGASGLTAEAMEALVDGGIPRYNRSTQTAQDGTYRVEQIPAGMMRVLVSSMPVSDDSFSYVMWEDAVIENGMVTQVDFELSQGERVDVRRIGILGEESESEGT